jgi:hypothetical protein
MKYLSRRIAVAVAVALVVMVVRHFAYQAGL